MSSLLDQKQFDFHLFSVQRSSAAPGFYKGCPRQHYEMVYKIDGASRQFFHDTVIDLVPDSIYLIPRFRVNSYQVSQPGTLVDIIFDIPEDSGLRDLAPELILLPPENKYKSQFLRAASSWSYKDPASYFRTHALVSGIFADLVADREKQYLQKSKFHRISPAVEYIRRNFRSLVSIPQLTALCGISDEYLRTLFRSYVGQTPLEYLHTLRLSCAYELLIHGRATVAQAAAESGFDNVDYFSRLFKRRYGISPSRVKELRFEDPYRRTDP